MEIDDGQYRGPYAVKIEDEGVDSAPPLLIAIDAAGCDGCSDDEVDPRSQDVDDAPLWPYSDDDVEPAVDMDEPLPMEHSVDDIDRAPASDDDDASEHGDDIERDDSASAANADDDALLAAEVPKNKGGRPQRAAIDIARKLWSDGIPESPHTVHDLLTRFFHTADKKNFSDAASREAWETHRWTLPNGKLLPTWDQAQVSLLRASPVKATTHVVCINDCTIIEQSLESMSKEDIVALQKQKCAVCEDSYANKKGIFDRVRTSGKIAHAARSAR
jgi:hypothetical protein